MRKLYLFLLLFVSCRGVSLIEITEPIFQKQEQLTYEIINSDLWFSMPRQLVAYDSVLIVFDCIRRDDSFHIFKKNSGSFIKSFGTVGRAGGEVISPSELIEYNKGEFITSDNNGAKILIYNVDSLLLNSKSFFKEFKYPYKMLSRVIGVFNEQFIVSGKDDNRFSLVAINDSLNTINIYSDYPEVINEKQEWAIDQLFRYSPFVQVSPDKSKMVYLTYIGAVAETFNLAGDSIVPRAVKCFVYPEIKVHKTYIEAISGVTVYGFTNVVTTNDYIYALYCGKNDTEYIVNTIYMFDWDLNPITKFTVDVDHLYCISYDSEDGCVYGIANDKEKNPNIIKFNEKFIK